MYHNGAVFSAEVLRRIAYWNDQLEIVRYLISQEVDVNVKESYGDTMLHQAAFHGELEIVEFLYAKGADVNAKNDRGKTALDIANDYGHQDVIAFLNSVS